MSLTESQENIIRTSESLTLIELYEVEFSRRVGDRAAPGAVTYYLTNHHSPITWRDIEWMPSNLKRGTFESSTTLEIPKVDLALDNVTDEISIETKFIHPISGNVIIWLYIEEIDDAIEISRGSIRGWKVTEEKVELTIASILDSIYHSLPRRRFGPQCPWRFQSIPCGVNAETEGLTVEFELGTQSTESKIYVPSPPDWSMKGGTLEITSGHAAGFATFIVSQNGNYINVSPPLPVAISTDLAKVTWGCPKDYGNCKNKSRFGGFPAIPIRVFRWEVS